MVSFQCCPSAIIILINLRIYHIARLQFSPSQAHLVSKICCWPCLCLPYQRFNSSTTTLAHINVHVWISSCWARTHKTNSRLRNLVIFCRNVICNTTVMYCCKAKNTQRKSIRSKVLMPLTADVAHPTSIAIVLTGLLLGVLSARVLGGIISQFSSLGNIYWMGVGSNNRCKKSK